MSWASRSGQRSDVLPFTAISSLWLAVIYLNISLTVDMYGAII